MGHAPKPSRRRFYDINGWSFVAPALLLIAVFMVYPIGKSLWMSVHSGQGTLVKFVGFGNAIRLASDPIFLRALSNTIIFLIIQVPIMIVVKTTMRVPRIIGTVTRRKSRPPVAPSSIAASTTSVGIALMAAESTTIAKPTWIQIMMTMRRKLFQGCHRSQFGGSRQPSFMTTADSRPTWSSAGSRYS